MRLINQLAVGLLAFAGTVSFSNTAQAAAIPWANPVGTVPGQFSWSNGESDGGLYGNPIVVGSSFLFFPSNFKAVSTNGVAATITDRLSVDLQIAPGKTLTGFSVHEIGDFQITGTGQVQASGQLLVTNTGPNGGQTLISNLVSTPGSPMNGPTAGALTWTADASVSILPTGWTNVHIVLNNILDAVSGPNSTATIQKKVVQGGVEITLIVPEPASISAIGLAGSMLLLRRRK